MANQYPFKPIVKEIGGIPDPANLIAKGLNYLSTVPLGPRPYGETPTGGFRGPLPARPATTTQTQPAVVPAYKDMTPEQQTERDYVGNMINQQREAMMGKYGLPALPTDSTLYGKTPGTGYVRDEKTGKVVKLDQATPSYGYDSRYEQEGNQAKRYQLLKEREQKEYDRQDMMQRGINARLEGALQVLNGSWANTQMKQNALLTLQALQGASGIGTAQSTQNTAMATRGLEELKTTNRGALERGQGQQALATAEATRAGTPFVGPAALQNIEESKARAGLTNAQTALQPYLGAAGMVKATQAGKPMDMQSIFKDTFSQMNMKQQAAILPLMQADNWGAIAKLMQNKTFLEG
jgi:hypothetical protein